MKISAEKDCPKLRTALPRTQVASLRLKPSVLLAALIASTSLPASGAEQIITLGDSLTFAYEASFCFRKNTLAGPVGDGFNSNVKNWVELLSSPTYRGNQFNLGARDSLQGNLLLLRNTFYFRQEYNWAIPGLKIGQLRSFITGQKTAKQILAEDPDFSTLVQLLNNTDYKDSDFDVAVLQNQIAGSAERLTLFIGGNDLREVYNSIYQGNSPGTFVDDYIDDAAFILDWVLAINPDLQIVVVNVPHVGITPDVQTSSPTDPVKTTRVTALLTDLNTRLAAITAARGLGYADVFTPTLPLLNPAPLCIHGITFFNSGSTTGDLNYVWLNGELSANFHPNTNAQALIANIIIDAFNRRYNSGIAPLTATEILGGMLDKSTAQIDMPFATWMSGFGLTGLGETDDSDGDGLSAAIEFALGLNPTWRDADRVTTALVNEGTELEIAYPLRLNTSPRFTLLPESSTTLNGFTPFAIAPAPGADGLARARLPVSGKSGFLRLRYTPTP